jgi:hypothetical protein
MIWIRSKAIRNIVIRSISNRSRRIRSIAIRIRAIRETTIQMVGLQQKYYYEDDSWRKTRMHQSVILIEITPPENQ